MKKNWCRYFCSRFKQFKPYNEEIKIILIIGIYEIVSNKIQNKDKYWSKTPYTNVTISPSASVLVNNLGTTNSPCRSVRGHTQSSKENVLCWVQGVMTTKSSFFRHVQAEVISPEYRVVTRWLENASGSPSQNGFGWANYTHSKIHNSAKSTTESSTTS